MVINVVSDQVQLPRQQPFQFKEKQQIRLDQNKVGTKIQIRLDFNAGYVYSANQKHPQKPLSDFISLFSLQLFFEWVVTSNTLNYTTKETICQFSYPYAK